MPTNLLTETVLSYREAVLGVLPSTEGRTIHVGTLHRWRMRGLDGVKLESLKIGGRWYTSLQALERFFNRLSGRAQAQPVDPTVPGRADEALARLRDEGF